MFFLEINRFYLTKWSTDGATYRVRLLSRKNNKFKVIYIDYGNEEEVDELYEWNTICDEHPIQAIILKIYGVQELANCAKLRLNVPKMPLINQIQYFLWDRLYIEHKARIM